MRFASLPLLLLVALAGCSDDDGSPDPDAAVPMRLDAGRVTPGVDSGTTTPGECAGDIRRVGAVYNGTPRPSHVPLTDGQILAIGTFGGCTGTFINDEWVLTANHCRVRNGSRFCVGPDASDPDTCFSAVEVESHPDLDMTVLRVDAPASTRIPELQPIPIVTEMLDESWFGTTAEAAGYGQQEDGSSGEREFTAEPIVGFDDRGTTLAIDGEGRRGVCFGDSGGPVMIIASDGSVRVAGDLSYGDPSCLGRDRYARVDLAIDWIERFTGPTVVDGAGCGSIDAAGRCNGDVAFWCEGDALQNERCDTCGWDAAAEGYRCISGADPCDGLDEVGECRGNTAVWCDRGTLRQTDCDSCGQTCLEVEEVGGFYCAPDPCEGLDYLGRCDGDVAVWCDEGTVRTQDCGRRGLRCDYVDDRIGYFCTR